LRPHIGLLVSAVRGEQAVASSFGTWRQEEERIRF
jgi:hypothetical protein